jgi:hypothetical protein
MLVCVVFLEFALRGYRALESTFRPRWYVVVDSPIVYGLNPERPEISSQGLRDDEIDVPKRKGTIRILILGDSIVYGTSVSRNMTFPSRLEDLLRKQLVPAEVINGGVPGYSPYNELQFYMTQGRQFDADIVIVAFCMNDVVNPRLHWSFIRERIDIPDQAIPNHDYDREHVLPRLEQTAPWKSELYSALVWRVARLHQKLSGDSPDRPQKIPTHITMEDTIGIHVLLDRASPEWRWFTSIYGQLRDAVWSDRATLIVALFPLAYQMDADYPFLPQEHIVEYCAQQSVPCIDLLSAFRQYPQEKMFLLGHSGYDDVWHLTEFGHELVAVEILSSLQKTGLLPMEKTPSR